ncbi:MAG: nucleotide exchange factor GrpE [Candidatus Omnitrophica bacterium]|nr:nucleotide exchange factor GrpE [Candidatus Omnitrophota bacterium]
MENKKENNRQTETKEEKVITLSESDYLKLKEDSEKAKEYWDRLLRLQAEFENTRKRWEKEKQEFIRFANEGVILELLNILDELERAVELAQTQHQDFSAFLKGMELILAHLYELLKEYGVKPIEAVGKAFDPHYHEAMMQVENKDVPENTVLEEFQKGYLLNERVIRTAKVKVSRRPND